MSRASPTVRRAEDPIEGKLCLGQRLLPEAEKHRDTLSKAALEYEQVIQEAQQCTVQTL